MERQPDFRIAMRLEGDRINAYYAAPDTMEGALWLGALAKSVADASPEAWERFKRVMRTAAADAIRATSGDPNANIEFGEEAAPEHERAGRG